MSKKVGKCMSCGKTERNVSLLRRKARKRFSERSVLPFPRYALRLYGDPKKAKS